MGDLNGIQVSDLLGLSQPLTKLLETVSCGIGKIYEPTHVRRMAKAKAKEIEIISGKFNENIVLPMSYAADGVTIDTTDANGLVKRAQNRFLFQEIQKQQNIEGVVACAYNELENEMTIDDTEVEPDWISTFFNCVANVSSEQMQILWGKLLAGEVKRPGSFSMRTLNILNQMSSKEARLFETVAKHTLNCKNTPPAIPDDYFIFSDKHIIDTLGLTFTDIQLLDEVGLLSSNILISVGLDISPGETECVKYKNYPVIEIENHGKELIKVQRSAYVLSASGKELLNVIDAEGEEDFEGLSAYFEKCKDVIIKDEFLNELPAEAEVKLNLPC